MQQIQKCKAGEAGKDKTAAEACDQAEAGNTWRRLMNALLTLQSRRFARIDRKSLMKNDVIPNKALCHTLSDVFMS